MTVVVITRLDRVFLAGLQASAAPARIARSSRATTNRVGDAE
jgi:hypothetical protein